MCLKFTRPAVAGSGLLDAFDRFLLGAQRSQRGLAAIYVTEKEARLACKKLDRRVVQLRLGRPFGLAFKVERAATEAANGKANGEAKGAAKGAVKPAATKAQFLAAVFSGFL